MSKLWDLGRHNFWSNSLVFSPKSIPFTWEYHLQLGEICTSPPYLLDLYFLTLPFIPTNNSIISYISFLSKESISPIMTLICSLLSSKSIVFPIVLGSSSIVGITKLYGVCIYDFLLSQIDLFKVGVWSSSSYNSSFLFS